ncbi:(Na+)-NQR maturation NqrM [Neisseriaceae bacterium TC5R-5]|nr:(Na+)-NQR maturation NqrM [Neisseriaceae bacterium TC5R-5]
MLFRLFMAAFIVFLLAFIGLALGYLCRRKSLQGSCGGIANLGLEKACDCDKPCARARRQLARR